jgi:glycosyltransferase involved in cell wall biosynthesis
MLSGLAGVLSTIDGSKPAPIEKMGCFDRQFIGGAMTMISSASSIASSFERPATSLRHVSIVTETYPPEINGVAHTLARLVKGLTARGIEVSLVRPYQKRCDASLSDRFVTLVPGMPLPGYKGLQFGLPAARRLKRLWTSCRPDAVYIATEGPLGWSAARIARRLGIAALSGFHTNYHSYSCHYRLGWLESLVFHYMKYLHNRTVRTLVPSFDLRDRLQSLGFRNVSCLGRGVDSHLFGPHRRSSELRRSWGLNEKDIAILYVGRLAPEKNLELAVKAYRAAHEINPSIRFVLVGDGPLRASLEKQCPDLVFSGMKTGEQLAEHYASGDVFLFPSLTETFGNVTLEAMASGLAVVAFNYAAARIHISHGITGVLAPYGDSSAYVASAIQLIKERGDIVRLGKQAREYAASIQWSRIVESFETMLSEARTMADLTISGGSISAKPAVAASGRL